MPYIGNTIRAADDYRLIDDISSGFNGSETSFALQVAGSAPVPFPKSPQQILISVNGVIQEPDPTGASGFNLVGTNIVFSSAPTNGHAFFGIIYATADYLNAGGNFPAGSLGAPYITFIGDENTGLFRKSGGSVGFVSDATEIANFDSNGLTISSGNLIIPGDIIHSGDTNTKIRFSNNDEIKLETGGVQRLKIDGSSVVFNDDGADVDFKIEGDSVANLFKVDASVDNIGIGMASPTFSSGNGIELADNFFLGFGSGNGTRPDFQFGTTAGATLDIRCGTGADTVDLVINTNGFLGIGTTSPSRKLHVDSSFIRVSDGYGLDTGGSSERVTLDNGFISLTTNSAERLRLDSSGRVLIGHTTSTPMDNDANNPIFAVEGTGNGARIAVRSADSTAGNGAFIYLTRTRGTSAGSKTTVQSGDSLGGFIFMGADGTHDTRAAIIQAQCDGTPGDNDMPGRLVFMTTPDGGINSVEHMRINNAGLIGMGTTSPKADSKLTVNGRTSSVVANNASYQTGLNITNDVNADFFVAVKSNSTSIGPSTSTPLCFHTGSTSNERMRIHGSTNQLQIGGTTLISSNPYLTLGQSANSQGNVMHLVNNGTADLTMSFISAGKNSRAVGIDISHDNFFIGRDNDDNDFVINNGGRIGINKTDSINARMEINENANTLQPLIIRDANNSNFVTHYIGFRKHDSEKGSIKGDRGGTSYNTTSDYRLKQNITSISDGITRIKQLLPKKFSFIEDETNTLRDGFLAHEVSSLVPEAVDGTKDAVDSNNKPIYQGIDHSKLVPLLTAALQEEIGKREALEARITALEAA